MVSIVRCANVFITDTYEVIVSSGMGEKIPYTLYEEPTADTAP